MLHRGKVSGILRCWAEAGNVLELGFSLSLSAEGFLK